VFICSRWPSLAVGCVLVGHGSFFVVAGHVLLEVAVGALLLCCREYAAFVGLVERFSCLLPGDGWRSETVGRTALGGGVADLVCALWG